MLREMGYAVTTAADAHTALAILRRDASIDLLFTDVVVPGALRTADLARTLEGERPDLPILYTSGYTTSAFIRELQHNPDTFFISKPYAREQLAALLREVFLRAPAVRHGWPSQPR